MNSFGRYFRVSIFGESHGTAIGVVMDGVPAGLPLAEEDFYADIDRRRSGARGTTPRKEADMPEILSGVYNGHATGAPLAIIFRNGNTHSPDYDLFRDIPRPGHADHVAAIKWNGNNDPRGGGHFSGRLTLPVVAAGVVAKKILQYGNACLRASQNGDPVSDNAISGMSGIQEVQNCPAEVSRTVSVSAFLTEVGGISCLETGTNRSSDGLSWHDSGCDASGRSSDGLSGKDACRSCCGASGRKSVSETGVEQFGELLKRGASGQKSIPVTVKEASSALPKAVMEAIEKAMKDGDSLGGIVECRVEGLPVGLGEPFFDSVESLISHAVFAIPGVRGIEFGDGFAASKMKGSEHNDPFLADGTPSRNGAGGINGGITNGAPVVFRVAFKPTSSIRKPQHTANLAKGEMTDLSVPGRHDACFALRAPVVVEAMAAIVLADLSFCNL